MPKPMFEFAFEGELLAFIVSGERLPLFALLPRRKPRTDASGGTVERPYRCTRHHQPHQRRLLRFAHDKTTGLGFVLAVSSPQLSLFYDSFDFIVLLINNIKIFN